MSSEANQKHNSKSFLDNMQSNITQKRRFPHAITILFGIMILVTIASYLLPSGSYERELVGNRERVIPNTYTPAPPQPIGFLALFKAIPLGFQSAVQVIFLVLAGGIMFGMMEKSRTIENLIGVMIKKLGRQKKYLIIGIITFAYSLLGVAVGYENNIALIPIAVLISLALGGDLILGAGISVGAMTVGFGLSPINPYTVGTGHSIAGIPLFSGALLRGILCLSCTSLLAYYNIRYFKKINTHPEKSLAKGLRTDGLNLRQEIDTYQFSSKNLWVIAIFLIGMGVILYGVFAHHWYMIELSAMFLIITLFTGLASRMNATMISQTVLESVGKAAPGAFMVGFATSIRVLMDMANISDAICFHLASLLSNFPLHASAVGMAFSQTMINFLIPSGSGQALATLPVMLPLGDILGLTSQVTILAFQIGDGISNLVNPTLGGLIAMLSMCRVPIDLWVRYIFPLAISVMGISLLFLIIAVSIGYQ